MDLPDHHPEGRDAALFRRSGRATIAPLRRGGHASASGTTGSDGVPKDAGPPVSQPAARSPRPRGCPLNRVSLRAGNTRLASLQGRTWSSAPWRLLAPGGAGTDPGHGCDRRSCHHFGSDATASAPCALVIPATIAATSRATSLLWVSSRVIGGLFLSPSTRWSQPSTARTVSPPMRPRQWIIH